MVLSGLQGIPDQLYEASYIDGCSPFQAFLKITIPNLKHILAVSIMISMILTWTKFEMIWVLTSGGPGFKTSILPTYVYTKSFQFFEMGLGSAVAVISMMIMIIFVVFYYKLLKRYQD
jgi:multiple sugar transport system permease protein